MFTLGTFPYGTAWVVHRSCLHTDGAHSRQIQHMAIRQGHTAHVVACNNYTKRSVPTRHHGTTVQ